MPTKIWRCYVILVSTCCVRNTPLAWGSTPNVSRPVGTTPIFSAFWLGLIRCDCPANNARSLDIEWTLDGMDILMRECQGTMVLAFALWKVSDSSGEPLGFSSTENNHLEGALALSQGLPLLIIAEET